MQSALDNWNEGEGVFVSILFKREGVCKAKDVSFKILLQLFQFPSNGKVYTKDNGFYYISRNSPKVFQFPSNGKVYVN